MKAHRKFVATTRRPPSFSQLDADHAHYGDKKKNGTIKPLNTITIVQSKCRKTAHRISEKTRYLYLPWVRNLTADTGNRTVA